MKKLSELKKDHKKEIENTKERIYEINRMYDLDINLLSTLLIVVNNYYNYNKKNVEGLYNINIILDGLEFHCMNKGEK